MIKIYCHLKHSTPSGKLCKECQELLDYALERLSNCPFKDEKPSCRKCPIHCYKPSMRKRIKEVMRFSGPRMLIYSPLEYFRHKIKEWKHGEKKTLKKN